MLSLADCSPEQIQVLAEEADRVLAQRSFEAFIHRVAPHLDTTAAHTQYVIRRWEAVADGTVLRDVTSMLPRGGKSTLARLGMAWMIGRNPTKEFLYCSYSLELASESTRAVREIINADRWPWPNVKVRADSSAVDRFHITDGTSAVNSGVVIACAPGSQIVGRGGWCVVIDDIQKSWEESVSEASINRIRNFLQGSLITRLYPDSRIVVIGTRWSLSDGISQLLEMEPTSWNYVRIPVYAEAGDVLGRAPGELLEWPGHITREFIESQRAAMSPMHFEAQYMADPAPMSGALFKSEHFTERYDATKLDRSTLYVVQAWDSSWGRTLASDYSACVTMGTDGSRLYLLGCERARMQLPELQQAVLANYDRWRPQAIVVEAAASGYAILQQLRGMRLPLIGSNPKGSKESRWQAASAWCAAGRVMLPQIDIAGLPDLLRELYSVPGSRHDDYADAFSLAVLSLATAQAQMQPSRVRFNSAINP